MITVIDSIMGSGKTSYMIDRMNQTHAKAISLSFDNEDHSMPKFIYVAPLLSEVDRITEKCPLLDFHDPEPIQGRKLHHLDKLVGQGKNICTTHSLFRLLTREMCQKVNAQGYTLVIDEALECVAIFEGLSQSDRDMLIENGIIYVEQATRKLRWNHEKQKNYNGEFNYLKTLCDNGNLVLVRDKILIWEFPSEFLSAFEDVIILTYIFPDSPMASYLQAAGLGYELKTLRDGRLVAYEDGQDDEAQTKERLRGLITIYEGPMNDVGKSVRRSNPLSKGWLENRTAVQLEGLKASTEYFFKSIAKTGAIDNAWTTFGPMKGKLKGARYSRGFIPCNAKATNDYRDKKSLAYLCNRFPHPYIAGYFQERGIGMDEDAYALSEMLQWLWRSQIRDGEPITVFVPSERMRNLLKDWLSNKSSGTEKPEMTTALAA